MKGRNADLLQIKVLRLALFGAYTFALAMSAAHLSSWYGLTLGTLHPATAWGLAFSLELTAFLLSLGSSRFGSALPTARFGAYGALGLVWVGNYLAMSRTALGMAPWEVFLQSLFVPVATVLVGKTIGDLYRLEEAIGPREKGVLEEAPAVEPPSRKPPHDPYGDPMPTPYGEFGGDVSVVLPLLWSSPSGATVEELALQLPLRPLEIEKALEELQARGLALRLEGGKWVATKSMEGRLLQ